MRRIAWFPASLALLTVVGAALRFSGLGDRDFWFDESCTFLYVHHLFDWPRDSNLLVESTNLPYYVLLRGWVALFGHSEAAFRSMSALAASLTIPLLGLLGRRLAGRGAGVLCALFVAFHPLHVHYAHEARAYALWMLCLVATIYLLVEASQRRRAIWWLLYGLSLLFCLHLHYFTMYLVPATIAGAFLARDKRQAVRRWLMTTALVGLAFAPYFVTAVWPASRQGGGAWIAPYWDPATAFLKTVWAFLPAGGYPAHLRGLSIASADTVVIGPTWLTALTRTIPAVIAAAVFIALCRYGWQRRDGWQRRGTGQCGSEEKDGHTGAAATHVFLGCMTLGPLVLAYLYSVLVRPNYLVARYDLVAWPGFVVWLAVAVSAVARGGGRRIRPMLVTSICLPMIACSLLPIARMASLKPPPTFHNVRAQRLARLCGPDDLVIAFSYDRDYLGYYLYRAGFSGTIVSFPSWLDRQVGWVDTEADLAPERRDALTQDARARIELVRTVKAAGGRVFVLIDYVGRVGGGNRGPIEQRFREATERAGFQAHSVDNELMILELTAVTS